MIGKLQEFIWAMRPNHPFSRVLGEDDATYIARYTMSMEALAAECIEEISGVGPENLPESSRTGLQVLLSEASNLEPSENMRASICRNAMRLVQYRLISEVLNAWPINPNYRNDDEPKSIGHIPSFHVPDVRVISGTEGLADFLGCGKTKAFNIIKRGRLMEAGVQYKVGNCWKFNAEKLEKLLADTPDFLK